MNTHNHPIEPGTEIDVIVRSEGEEDITVVGIVRAVHSRDLILGFGLIEVEHKDPRTGQDVRNLSLIDYRKAEDDSGLTQLAALYEARAEELRRAAEEAAQ